MLHFDPRTGIMPIQRLQRRAKVEVQQPSSFATTTIPFPQVLLAELPSASATRKERTEGRYVSRPVPELYTDVQRPRDRLGRSEDAVQRRLRVFAVVGAHCDTEFGQDKVQTAICMHDCTLGLTLY